jgi:hypothetical protein
MLRIPRLLFLITLAVAAAPDGTSARASEEFERGCRCVLTFSSGPAHETYCDGFDPSTHQRCACEKRTAPSGAPTCLSKSARPAEDSAARSPDRHTKHRN